MVLHNERVKLAPISQNSGLLSWASQEPGARKGGYSDLPPASPHCLGRSWLHPPCLIFQGSGTRANTPGVATWRSRPISVKLAEDLPRGGEHLPWRLQVNGTIPCRTVKAWVNVPNHVKSCQPEMKHWPWQRPYQALGELPTRSLTWFTTFVNPGGSWATWPLVSISPWKLGTWGGDIHGRSAMSPPGSITMAGIVYPPVADHHSMETRLLHVCPLYLHSRHAWMHCSCSCSQMLLHGDCRVMRQEGYVGPSYLHGRHACRWRMHCSCSCSWLLLHGDCRLWGPGLHVGPLYLHSRHVGGVHCSMETVGWWGGRAMWAPHSIMAGMPGCIAHAPAARHHSMETVGWWGRRAMWALHTFTGDMQGCIAYAPVARHCSLWTSHRGAGGPHTPWGTSWQTPLRRQVQACSIMGGMLGGALLALLRPDPWMLITSGDMQGRSAMSAGGPLVCFISGGCIAHAPAARRHSMETVGCCTWAPHTFTTGCSLVLAVPPWVTAGPAEHPWGRHHWAAWVKKNKGPPASHTWQ